MSRLTRVISAVYDFEQTTIRLCLKTGTGNGELTDSVKLIALGLFVQQQKPLPSAYFLFLFILGLD